MSTCNFASNLMHVMCTHIEFIDELNMNFTYFLKNRYNYFLVERTNWLCTSKICMCDKMCSWVKVLFVIMYYVWNYTFHCTLWYKQNASMAQRLFLIRSFSKFKRKLSSLNQYLALIIIGLFYIIEFSFTLEVSRDPNDVRFYLYPLQG